MNTAIIISSCDHFSDCWEPMIYSFKKKWPDCPYPIYFISNYKEMNTDYVNFLRVGKDLGFASNLKKALKMIEYNYVIYFQEDYFIDNIVNSRYIDKHLTYCIEKNIDYLKIKPDSLYRDNLRIGNSDYCKNPLDIKYSINTAIAIWKKDKLEELCVDGFSGWDFERKIIKYINNNNIEIVSETLHSSVFPLKGIAFINGTAIRRGKWTKAGIDYLKQNGFENRIKGRSIESDFLTKVISYYSPRSMFRIPVSLVIKVIQKLNL